MKSEVAELLETARGAARAASSMLAQVPRDVGAVRTKSGIRDLVTEWDTRSEELIRRVLAERAPGIPILGEEGGVSQAEGFGGSDALPPIGSDTRSEELIRSVLAERAPGIPILGEEGGVTSQSGGGGSGDLWLVDPIDGTYNFAHRLPIFAVSIALERAGEPVVGVVSAPALGYEFYASKGQGSFFAGEAACVSAVRSLESAILATGFPPDRSQSHNFAEWAHFQRHAGACRRLGAASLDLAFVACGWLDGYWETRLSPWDLAAGALLVREAGGMVTDITGGPFRIRSGNAVASNGAIHRELVNHLERVGGVIHDRGKDRPAPS